MQFVIRVPLKLILQQWLSSTPRRDATRRLCFLQQEISSVQTMAILWNQTTTAAAITSCPSPVLDFHGLQRIRGKITAQSGCVYHITSGKRESARENWNVASVDMYRVINTLQGCESCDRLLIPIIMHITLRHFQNIKFEYICFLSCDIYKHVILNVHIRAFVNVGNITITSEQAVFWLSTDPLKDCPAFVFK